MLRAPVAFGVSLLICMQYKFDLLSKIFESQNSLLGYVITAATIAGGSKGAILLFQGILGFGHEAVKMKIKSKTERGND